MPDPFTALVVGGASLIGSSMQSSAAGKAADIQAGAAQAGIAQQGASAQLAIDEQRRQFDALQKILQPYVAVGAPALEQQQALLGLRGPEAERAAIERISGGEQFKALAEQGEGALLSRASATGGLRGGNIQAALGQFRPQLLSNLIEKQYGQLGGLATLGQSSAAGVGAAGTAAGTNIGNIYGTQGTNIANLLGQQGAAQAGGEIAQGRAYGNLFNLPAQMLGFQYGAGGRAGMGFGF